MPTEIIKKTPFWLILIFIAAIPIISPLTKEGYFPTHDGQWAVVRLTEMHRELKDGQFPPRWSDYLNHGFGYPLFLFTYPFPYYLGELIHLAGFSFVDSIKVVFLLSVLVSAIGMFFLGKKIDGNFAGFVSSVLYMYAPFRLVNLYVRGSIGESLSFAIFPLLFLATLNLITNPDRLRLVAVSILVAVLITTHNAVSLLFLPFWLAFIFVAIKMYAEDLKLYTIKYFLPAILLGLGIASYFWLPALLEKQYILLSTIPLADKSEHFIKPLEFLYSPWSYGLKPSFQLGWVHIIIFIIDIILLLILKGIEGQKLKYIGFFTIGAVAVSLLMTNEISNLLWKLPLLSSIDFPWRMMTPLAFFMSLASVYIVEKRLTKVLALILLIFAFFLVQNFAKPAAYFEKEDQYYSTNDDTTTSMDELMPIWVKDKPTNKPDQKIVQLNGNVAFENIQYDSKSIKARGYASGPSIIGINTIYFPGWILKVNDTPIIPDYSNSKGIMTFSLPPGNFNIETRFESTPLRKLADAISLLSIIVCVFVITSQGVQYVRQTKRW